MTIWKFPLAIADEQIIEWPEINRPLAVQVQNGTPCLWLLVDPEARKIRVRVRIFGTGHPGIIPSDLYVGTFQIHGGNLVFHVFLAGVVS